MGVVLRLSLHGTKKKPFYRVVAADSRKPRDGRFLEIVGTYNPKLSEKKCTWKGARIQYWLSNGAKPSQTVGQLLKAEPATV